MGGRGSKRCILFYFVFVLFYFILFLFCSQIYNKGHSTTAIQPCMLLPFVPLLRISTLARPRYLYKCRPLVGRYFHFVHCLRSTKRSFALEMGSAQKRKRGAVGAEEPTVEAGAAVGNADGEPAVGNARRTRGVPATVTKTKTETKVMTTKTKTKTKTKKAPVVPTEDDPAPELADADTPPKKKKRTQKPAEPVVYDIPPIEPRTTVFKGLSPSPLSLTYAGVLTRRPQAAWATRASTRSCARRSPSLSSAGARAGSRRSRRRASGSRRSSGGRTRRICARSSRCARPHLSLYAVC